jgi:hypothetical protein
MKFIKLLNSAYIGGRLRHPHEGVLHLEDEDAQRVLDNKDGEDVSADFADNKDAKSATAERVSMAQPKVPADHEDHPHQAELDPGATSDQPQTRRKPSASKE